MDAQFLLPLPRLSSGTWCPRRVQRQVHVQSIRSARRVVCYLAQPYPPDLSQLLPAGEALAVYRDPTRPRSRMNHDSAGAGVLDLEPAKANFRDEVIAGLSGEPRTLPCKFFYDQRGAALFQKICELPEYYITRTELQILETDGQDMASHLGAGIELIGLGTGAGTKTRILLEKLRDPAVYVPVDISSEQLAQSTALFRQLFPKLEILPICADYLQPFQLPSPEHIARKVVYFPGSTIGNFDPQT